MSKKRYDHLFEKIVDEENLYRAYRKAMLGQGKFRLEAMQFARDEVARMQDLQNSLIDGSYRFGGYSRFMVFEPKERVIDAPHFVDKVVQLAIKNVLNDIYIKTFIPHSYACIEGRGTHSCANYLQKMLRQAQWQYGDDATIIKGDVKKFFYTIDRDILKILLRKKIACIRTLGLLDLIIDSASAIDEKGLPLGNTLSQICANIYLNELDYFCKRKLSIKYYARYMDDFFIIVENKTRAIETLKQVELFLESQLNLSLNKKKTKYFPVRQGVNAIGYKIYTTHKLLRDSSKRKIKRKARAMPALLRSGKLTPEKAEQILNSWRGHASHADAYNFTRQLMKRNKFIVMQKKSQRKVALKIEARAL